MPELLYNNYIYGILFWSIYFIVSPIESQPKFNMPLSAQTSISGGTSPAHQATEPKSSKCIVHHNYSADSIF